jgi:hypothetical protein
VMISVMREFESQWLSYPCPLWNGILQPADKQFSIKTRQRQRP